MLHEHFRTLGRFNQWTNREIYRAVAGLPEAEYRKVRPAAYFGSIHGTLNHILAIDRLWFGRVAGVPSGITRLDVILYDNFPALDDARQAEDRRIVELVDGLDEATLAGERAYKDTKGNPGSLPVRLMLATVFNHQTHHRGQVHALLKEAGVEPPALDLPVFLAATKPRLSGFRLV
ncbi:MAG: DinB family protein [Pseudomonadota bacterium]